MDIGLTDFTLAAVKAESIKAEVKHGKKNILTNKTMPVELKMAALVEEVGEVFELFTYDKRPAQPGTKPLNDQETIGQQLIRYDQEMSEWRIDLCKELIQVANLAAAWAESVDQGGT